jgi:dipeptidyl aminopeptidase/acylaminoacyl peptidase
VTSVYGFHDIPADYSPDGKYIVFYRSVSPWEGAWDLNGSLWIVPTGGGNAHPIKTPRSVKPNPSARWSPDGTTIVFSNARAQWASSLWTVDADGSHLKKLFNGSDGRFAFFPEWSPDGRAGLAPDRHDEGYDEHRPGNQMPMSRGHVLTKIDLQLASIRGEIDEIEAATVEDDAQTADEKTTAGRALQAVLDGIDEARAMLAGMQR